LWDFITDLVATDALVVIVGGCFLFSVVLEYRNALLDVGDDAARWTILQKIGTWTASRYFRP
jgi:hypothetical protein